jgi:hypothetical protein
MSITTRFRNKTRNEEHNREEHNTPTTTNTCIRGTAYASAKRESSDFLIKHIVEWSLGAVV